MYLEKSNVKLYIIPVISAAIAIILLGYSSYAWVSMNKSVRATGETVRLTAPSSLEISLTGNYDDWHESVLVNLRDKVKDICPKYNTKNDFYLLPSSSYCGFDNTIWQTSHVSGIIKDETQLKSSYIEDGRVVAWNDGTSAYEGNYIDILLWFRNSSESDIDIYLADGSNISNYGGITSNVYKTVRVGFLNSKKSKNSNDESSPLVYAYKPDQVVEIIKGNDKKALSLYEADYFNTSNDENKKLFSMVASNFSQQVEYSWNQIVVRIWIEGQDKYCVASIGGKTFEVNLAFSSQEKNNKN